MKLTKNTIAATFAAVLVVGLTGNPASAKVRVYSPSDISFVTHSDAATESITQVGHTTNEYSRNDISAVTHQSVMAGVMPMAKASGTAYGRNDITAITHN